MRVTLQKYTAAHLDDCVALLADAFVANPLHRAAFGGGRLDQNRIFFRIGLRRMFIGQSFIALESDRDGVCGYMHFNTWPNCLPAPEELPRAVATQLQPLGAAIPQVIRWFGRWCHLDPGEPHVHLGPIGVAPNRQRQKVGTALMRRYIDQLERERTAGYLETDRSENVEFYKRFGFTVRSHEQLIGVPVWYMWRPSSD